MKICDPSPHSQQIPQIHIIGWRSICYILGAFFLFTSCSSGKSSVPSSPTAPQRTQVPTSTSTIQPTAPIYSQTPTPEPSVNLPTPFLLETKHFQSPQGFFEIDYPADWLVTQEDAGVTFEAPSHMALFRVSLINTGYPLDANSFIRLVDGREANIFQVYQQYYEISRTIESQMVIIKKQFSLNSVNNIVLSSYHQSDQVVYIVDFWSDQETFGITEEVFSSILPTLITSPAAVVGQDYTTLDDSLFYETDHFSFQVPVYWKLTRTSAESSVVDTFRSPDEMAIFQTIVYNDGRPISKSEAGSFVLVLLNNFYTNEITVTSDRITIDQQEELTWYSSLSNMQGITSFQVRDNTLIIFTILYKNDYESNYRPILEQILSTYQAIPATDNP